ncbi:hypothetical protein A2U01_0006681 [Trifolium medium]|uniref:Uncharacterized protein n=1 Tax=Trifolium medium TaxID=97028 RepID=A0A392MFK9_9FABA|nr:hypothetical protein [Trifolium medium]
METPRSPNTEKKGLKKRKAEKKASGERSQKKKQVIIQSDSEADVEADIQDIMASEKKTIEGRRIPEYSTSSNGQHLLPFRGKCQEVEVYLPKKNCTRNGA